MNQMFMLDESGSRVATPVDIIRQARRVSGMAFPQPIRLGSEADLVAFARYRFAPLQDPTLLIARLNQQSEVMEYFTGLMVEARKVVALLRTARLSLQAGERLAVIHALPPRMVGRTALPDTLVTMLHEQAVTLEETPPLYVRCVIPDELLWPNFIARPKVITPIEVQTHTGRRMVTHQELVQAAYQLNARRFERGQVLWCAAQAKAVLQTCLDSFDDPSTGLLLMDEHSRFIAYHHLCYGMLASAEDYVSNVLDKVRDSTIHRAELVRYKPQLDPRLESAEREVAEAIFAVLEASKIEAFKCLTIGVDGVSIYESHTLAPSMPMVAIGAPVQMLH